jgi:hypothetical protein
LWWICSKHKLWSQKNSRCSVIHARNNRTGVARGVFYVGPCHAHC